MAIRIKHKVNPRIFDDVEQKDCLFAPDDDLSEVTLDGFTRMNGGKFAIGPSSSETLPFGDVTVVKGYYVELQPADASTSIPVATINVNALGARPFVPGGTGKPAKSFHEGTVTSIEIANADLSAVLEGRFAVWGDDT